MKYIIILLLTTVTHLDLQAQVLKLNLVNQKNTKSLLFNTNNSNKNSMAKFNHHRMFVPISLLRSGIGEQETLTLLISNNSARIERENPTYFPKLSVRTYGSSISIKEIINESLQYSFIDAR